MDPTGMYPTGYGPADPNFGVASDYCPDEGPCEEDVWVSSGDHSHRKRPNPLDGSTVSDLVSQINELAGDCCVKTLTINVHGTPKGLWIRGRTKEEYEEDSSNWDPATDNINDLDPEVASGISEVNMAAMSAYIAGNIDFCEDCTIIIASCNVGLGNIPQYLANETGCRVLSPKGYCTTNVDDVMKSRIRAYSPSYGQWGGSEDGAWEETKPGGAPDTKAPQKVRSAGEGPVK